MHDKLIKLVRIERKITIRVLELLQRVSDSNLHLTWGYSNLYDYLTRGLGYSEGVAYQRIAAIRIMREVPEIKEQISSGALSFSTLAKSYKVLKNKSATEKRKILNQLNNKTYREVDKILATEAPQETLVSKKHYVNSNTIRITIDVSEQEYESIEKLRALRSHIAKNDRDLLLLLVQEGLKTFSPKKLKESKSSQPRQIPKSVKNELLRTANYQCQHPGCKQTHFLQIDHIKSVYQGGNNKSNNLQVLCAAHNQWKGS